MSDAVICIYALDGHVLQETLPKSKTENVWVHLYSDAEDCPITKRELGLSELVIDIMTATESRPGY